MFDDWKRAWRQAVENFRRELGPSDPELGTPASGRMHTDLVAARGVLRRLDSELRQAETELAKQREEEATCLRREGLARGIGDTDTADLAAEYARRAAEHAAILERKLAILREERELRHRDLETMETIARERHEVGPGVASAPDPDQRDREDVEFRNMERSAKEKAAEARLEELRRRMQSS